MTKTKQIDVLCRVVKDYRRENRRLKAENRQLAAAEQEQHDSALFWQGLALQLMQTHPSAKEVQDLFAAGAVLPQKQKLFTSD